MTLEPDSEWKPLAARSALCLLCTIIGWAMHEHHAIAALAWYAGAYVSGGWDLSIRVWEGIKQREFGTDFLMLLVAAGAAGIGQYAEGAVLMFLFATSGAMERFAHGRTEREISALLRTAPKTARLLENGGEREVPVAELRVGQHVRVTANEQIPVDLQIEDGESACDESMLTGEAEPVPKARGDNALAGTLNLHGVLEGRVLRAAEDSALQRIIRLIEHAQHLKAPVQRFTDRFGTRYTVLVLVLCTVVFFVWWLAFHAPAFVSDERQSAFYRAMTLLVVMSPCALVLSVPSAILSAIAYGARRGVLFRGGAAIEMLANITLVAMDKTGTLTEGNMQFAGVEVLRGSEDELLAVGANLARLSNHPMSRSIAKEGNRRGLPLEEPERVETVSGAGLQAEWRGQPAILGHRSMVTALHADAALPAMRPDASEVWVATPTLLGRILLRDRLRPEAAQLVAQLHSENVRTVMLTGDKSGTAERMGKEAGVGEILSQLRPEQKVEAIERFKMEGATVAMIGDGVNDAPCLAAAHIGVAMGARGSDAAIEQAEVVLMNDRLENFLVAFHLSCRARTIIRQNLLISLGVIIGMAITTLLAVRLPLAAGVLAHEGSTVIVVMNSLRLLFHRERRPKADSAA
jgi:Zn2+/Cd2+-exporting ATPase